MSGKRPVILWLRRDLRLSDHPALHAAQETGAPVVPVFIRDEHVERLGAAPKFRLGLSLRKLADDLLAIGSRLVLRSGDAARVLDDLVAETGAASVFWSRTYDPGTRHRDEAIKSELKSTGVTARSFGGHVMFEPWAVETKQGGMYRVYSPFWRAVKDLGVDTPLGRPAGIKPPQDWPQGEGLASWNLSAPMQRGAAVVGEWARPGEAAAQQRLAEFVDTRIADYRTARDFVARDATSRMSEHLALGEISPHQCWHAGMRALHEGKAGAEHFLKELVWREFAYHLMFHTPHILTENWREGWDRFPWRRDETLPEVQRWKQGRTGVPFVDAAMREMYVTGTMHNRARMIVASYLTKHCLVDWRIGQAWFEDCLIDWDPASNAMGWQWVAGSGPDAAPYFRVFNPETQAVKFDPDAAYRDRWIAEDRRCPSPTALSYFDAIPQQWDLTPEMSYPEPAFTLGQGRERALEAYEKRDF